MSWIVGCFCLLVCLLFVWCLDAFWGEGICILDGLGACEQRKGGQRGGHTGVASTVVKAVSVCCVLCIVCMFV
ncbi:MAG: hypothetical protein JOS17DRAFT_746123 [Linnemannia elongata]|nr:MAG: hypothetical protein JOS17DRAFT_746123 [Linnemannia elongata]